VEPISCPNTIPGSGTNCGLDLVKSQNDNAFGQGAKEDDLAPTVVFGSIPPSKDDLLRFYVNKERAGGNDYLYLAWERSNLLGSAHMDFEFNQSTTPSANGVTPQRQAGDLLIDFDFGGSGVPVLALHRWITTGSPADCEANNSLPCWNKGVDLTAAGYAEAAVNSVDVVDTNPPGAPRTLPGNTKNGINSTFGEAAINLTGANIFSQGVCTHFGSATLKSRSSGNSFTSELKDFIAPIPVNISNCGNIIIHKHTDPRGVNQSFSYTTTSPAQTPLNPATFTLNDSGNTSGNSTGNTQDYGNNVFAGSYSVTEGADPAGFSFKSLTCTATGTGTSYQVSGKTVNITLASDGIVECTYVNEEQLGAIMVTKTRKHAADGTGDHPQAGVSFTVNGVTKQTGIDGTACFDGLSFGQYAVTETVPSGYDADDGVTKNVTVDNNANCSDAVYAGETVSFRNTPLTDLLVSVDSQVNGGTASTITCVDSTSATVASGTTDANGDGSASVTGLHPGTYTCTVVIDP
jgi:hypothetical protein